MKMNRADDIERMLADIRSEVHLTRDYIKCEAFSPRVMAAMAKVPRHAFVPEELLEYAYDNGPLPIGHGQTISQPYIVALMSELLQVGEGDTVLEIGTGSGYQTAVLSQLVRQVYSVEIVEPLASLAKGRFKQLNYHNIEATTGDGYLGWPEHAPYDGIIVTAAAPYVPPPLEEQLRPGARLIIPVSDGFVGQQLLVVEKGADGVLRREPLLPVAFVPLVRQ
jgi:protein-L-isoaspartate(D-aspartate) O-methyltransferase